MTCRPAWGSDLLHPVSQPSTAVGYFRVTVTLHCLIVPSGGESAVVLHVRVGPPPHREEAGEFRSLALAAGAEIAAEMQVKLRAINPRLLIGSGKLDELQGLR